MLNLDKAEGGIEKPGQGKPVEAKASTREVTIEGGIEKPGQGKPCPYHDMDWQADPWYGRGP